MAKVVTNKLYVIIILENTYLGDYLKWQQKISERIAKTIEIAENDMREHDKEVQQFISHLHSYLYTRVQELKLIPKKTRIKVKCRKVTND